MSKLFVLSLLAACGSGGGFIDAAERDDAPPPGGTFSAQWTVTDADGMPVGCSQIGGQFVTVTLRNRATPFGTNQVFSCTSLGGQSPVVDVGIYDMRFELSGTTGVLATSVEQLGVEIVSAQNTPLAPLTFAVDATGGLALKLDAGKASNCGAGPAGAGITSTTITLEHASNLACEPVTFTISAGATKPATTYTVNCATPVVGPCIEDDQTLRVTRMPSDGYRIHVRGRIGAVSCFTNDDSLQVPAMSMVLTRTLNLAQQVTPGC
ncbi:MAG: hypothetical protein WKG01_26130 [Kofleriaceae bacterium]